MKKLLCLALVLLMAALPALAEDGVLIVSGAEGSSASGDLVIGETINIDKVCDLTLLGCAADRYAMSIAAYNRSEDETVKTPEVQGASDNWGSYDRYKYKKSDEGKVCYAEVYVDINTALKASSEDYYLLDVRLSILNRKISPMDLADELQAKLTYMDEYVFEEPIIRTEVDDTIGNPKEWLSEVIEIPMLVEKNVHVIFEVPKIVADSTDSLVATFTLDGSEYTAVLR